MASTWFSRQGLINCPDQEFTGCARTAGEPQRLVDGAGWLPVSFSPDGKRLGYWTRVPPYGLWTLPLDLTEPDHPRPGQPESLLKSNVEVRGPTFSPDGRWLGYASFEAVRLESYVRSFPVAGGKWQVSSDGGGWPVWLPNGRQFIYFSETGLRVVEYTAKGDSFVASPARPWSEKAPRVVPGGGALTTDGKRLALLVPSGQEDIKPTTHVVFLLNFFDELRRKVSAGK